MTTDEKLRKSFRASPSPYVVRKRMFSPLRILIGVVVVIVMIWFVVAQPTVRSNEPSSATVPVDRLMKHVQMLSETYHPRNWQHRENLDASASYIVEHFTMAGARVTEQVFTVQNASYKNMVARFGPDEGAKLIVGAHYDSCMETPGADDNASGVAALIELGYLLGSTTIDRPIELVAYTLEEPPFFRTEHMGSFIHASELKHRNEDILGVIVLEMVGYFSDERFSQSYPSALLYLMYPTRGNFIGVIGRWDQGAWIKRVKVGMKGTTDLPVRSMRAPTSLPGIDFSDHLNYWAHGYPAVMITDTAFYRNREYHKPGDTKDRLDYQRMKDVVVAVYETIR